MQQEQAGFSFLDSNFIEIFTKSNVQEVLFMLKLTRNHYV